MRSVVLLLASLILAAPYMLRLSRSIAVRETRRLASSAFTREALLSQPAIYSDANDKIKAFKALQMKKKRDAQNVILLEGHRQVIDALSAGFRPKQILLSQRAITSAPLAQRLLEALSGCDPSSTQVLSVEDQVLSRLSDVVQGQGVLAAFERPAQTSLPTTALASPAPLLLLLDRPSDPGNVGTIVRAAFGLGVDALLLVDGCDAFAPKATRAAMGMNLQLPCIELGWAGGAVPACLEALPASTRSRLQLLLAVPDTDAGEGGEGWETAGSVCDYFSVDLTRPTLLVVGSEAAGIGPEARDLGAALGLLQTGAGEGGEGGVRRVRIPCAPGRGLESFNAAMAATVLLAEACKQRLVRAAEERREAEAALGEGKIKGKGRARKEQ